MNGRRDNHPRIWESVDYGGPFSIIPQGMYAGVVTITEPGPDNDSNVGVIPRGDVLRYLDREQSEIIDHGFVVPTINFRAGTITIPNGTPPGLQSVITDALRIARELQGSYHGDSSFLVKTAKMDDFYIAMIHLGFGVSDSQFQNIAGRVGIIEHTRYFHVELLGGRDFPHDYSFEPPHYDDDSETTTTTEDDNDSEDDDDSEDNDDDWEDDDDEESEYDDELEDDDATMNGDDYNPQEGEAT